MYTDYNVIIFTEHSGELASDILLDGWTIHNRDVDLHDVRYW